MSGMTRFLTGVLIWDLPHLKQVLPLGYQAGGIVISETLYVH